MAYFERRERERAAANPSYRPRAPRKACADELGLTKRAVYLWGRMVPPVWAAILEDISDGELVFDPYAYVAAGYHRPAHLRPSEGGAG